jgi:hypothetical protein
MVSSILGCELGSDYFSMSSNWIHKNKYYDINVFTSVVLRGIWLTRNNFVFNKQGWLDVNVVLRRILSLIKEWRHIFKKDKMTEMMSWLSSLEELIQEPLKIKNA